MLKIWRSGNNLKTGLTTLFDQVTAVLASVVPDKFLLRWSRFNVSLISLLASTMSSTMQSAKKSTGRVRAEKNSDDLTHKNEISENFEHVLDAPFFSDEDPSDKDSSDEGSDYGKCA